MQQCHKSWPPDEVKCRKLVVVTFSSTKCDISLHNFIRTGKINFICRNSKYNLSENILKIAFLRWKYNHHLHMFHKIIGTILDQNCLNKMSTSKVRAVNFYTVIIKNQLIRENNQHLGRATGWYFLTSVCNFHSEMSLTADTIMQSFA